MDIKAPSCPCWMGPTNPTVIYTTTPLINKELTQQLTFLFVLETTRLTNNLGAFLTAMTFDSIHVEFYMTKFSFLTVFFSVCVSAAKTPCMIPRGAILNRFCAVFM